MTKAAVAKNWGSLYLWGDGSRRSYAEGRTGSAALLLSPATLVGSGTVVTPGGGNTINAASTSYADVLAAYNAASDGDTIQIPAGDSTWTTQLAVTKGVYIKGAGQGVTILRDGISKNGTAASRMFSISVNHPQRVWMSDFSFASSVSDPNTFNLGHIFVGGTQRHFRMFNVTVLSCACAFIRTTDSALGVISQVNFTSSFQNLLLALPATWGGSAYGDGSWATQLWWGNDMSHGFTYPPQWFVEQCTITRSNAGAGGAIAQAFDGWNGARVVLRYNTLDGMNFTSHGTDSGQRQRGIRQMEVYNNTFIYRNSDANDFCVWMRSGTGVAHNNTISLPGGGWTNSLLKASNCRDSDAGCGGPSFPPWGACNGTSAYDTSRPGGGLICVDQPGSGTSRDLGGVESVTPSPLNNALDPIYLWSNSGTNATNVGASANVQSGRDFIIGTARPGYTPYTYPHPIRSTSW